MLDRTTKRPVASVIVCQTVNGEDQELRKEAYLLGSVTRVSGKPVACEVETEEGRTTLVPYATVEALNDAALEVLTAPGPPVEVHADDIEAAAKADFNDFETEDADFEDGLIDEDPEDDE